MLTPAQQQVNSYFQSSANYWKRIYETRELMPLIYQTRQAAVLDWISELRLPIPSQILEIGCGAGVLTTELARTGYRIQAVDAAPAMVELTRQSAAKSGLADCVTASLADVHALPFPAAKFDLVIAIGVIPWLHDEARGVREMQRVLKPDGHLIVTADNEWRLIRLTDPRSTPMFLPLRQLAKSIVCRAGRYHPLQVFQVKRHTPSEIHWLFEQAGVREVKSKTVGFGPFTIFGHQLFTDKFGISIHLRLQSLADRKIFPFHMSGSHYLSLARK
jgi:ubiquinone/menaquinone biosynthesis C-methylase UbiE